MSAPAASHPSCIVPLLPRHLVPRSHYLVPQLRGLGPCCSSHRFNQVADLLDSCDHLIVQCLCKERVLHETAAGLRSLHAAESPGKDAQSLRLAHSMSLTHLLGDILPGGQLLADGSEGCLVHLPQAPVQDLNGLIALPLSWSFVPE